MSDQFKYISEQIPGLSFEQLTALEDKITLQKDMKNPKVDNGPLEQFHKWIDKKLQSALGEPETPFNKIRKTAYYKKLIVAHEFVIGFLNEVVKPQKPTVLQTEAFYKLYADLMFDWQKKLPDYYTPSGPSLISTYDRFPELVDRAYPEYVINGCGYMIFSPRQNPDDL